MYYVNREQIDERLAFIPRIVEALEELNDRQGEGRSVFLLARERAVHLAIESVTDIGSLLIDGFLMREASSYEDIIGILHGEQVISDKPTAVLLELVSWRKPLVQQYTSLDQAALSSLAAVLPRVLSEFARSVQAYVSSELAVFETRADS